MSRVSDGSAPPAIFIHGIAPRSGTNYLRWLLACHAQVAVSPQKIWEFPHLSRIQHLQSYVDQLLGSSKLPGLYRSDLLAALGSGLLGLAHRGLDENVRVLIKEPSVQGIEYFFDFFPGAHLVLLIRDGRDVSDSLARTRFGDVPIRRYRRWAARLGLMPPLCAERARVWRDASRRIASVCTDPKGPWASHCAVLRYEDLVGDFEATVGRLLGRLGLEPSQFDWDAARNLKIRGSSFVGVADPRQGLNWSGVDRNAVTFDPIGHWHSWAKRERAAFLRVAGEELRRWGYPLEI